MKGGPYCIQLTVKKIISFPFSPNECENLGRFSPLTTRAPRSHHIGHISLVEVEGGYKLYNTMSINIIHQESQILVNLNSHDCVFVLHTPHAKLPQPVAPCTMTTGCWATASMHWVKPIIRCGVSLPKTQCTAWDCVSSCSRNSIYIYSLDPMISNDGKWWYVC